MIGLGIYGCTSGSNSNSNSSGNGPTTKLAAPTDNYSPYARYGDFLSAQMKSLRKFGYGIYIAKMQAANGPVCSTFWLYSDAPAPGAMPEIAQMWRWNEFDFEFVPYTQATQNSYITLEGSFPRPTVTYYGSQLDFNNPDSQQIKPSAVNWVANRYMTDDVMFSDMATFYNKWMIGSDPRFTSFLLDPSVFNFEGAKNTTGIIGTIEHKTGYLNVATPPPPPTPCDNGYTCAPGWTQAADWKYPLTAVKAVDNFEDVKNKMVAINWWRTPVGKQSINVNLPGYAAQTFDYIIKLPSLDGSTLPQSATTAAMNNETYVLPKTAASAILDPYVSLNTYTIVWTKTRVAFYINAGNNGRDVAGSTPVAVYDVTDYPSMTASGTQAQQGTITWADTSLRDQLGQVSINLANYVAFKAAAIYDVVRDGQGNVIKPPRPNNCPANSSCPVNSALPDALKAGAGWSGLPPNSSWAGADAYVRSVEYYPLVAGDPDGSHNADFDFTSSDKWVFDLGDGSWTSANFNQKISQYFGILYAQDYTQDDIKIYTDANDFVNKIEGTLVDSKSPLAVNFVENADGSIASDRKPLMKLSVMKSQKNPSRNFFRLGTNMNTGAPISATNPFMYATIDTDGTGAALVGVSGPSTPLAFFAPPAGKDVDATVTLYYDTTYHGAFPPLAYTPNHYSCVINLKTDVSGNISWSFKSGKNIVAKDPSNLHLITVTMPTGT